MLRAIGFMLKLGVFSAVVLVIGNSVRWKGHTLSDEVRMQMSHAERSDVLGQIKNWANGISKDAARGIRLHRQKFQKSEIIHENTTDEIAASERQKLRALIQELNSSRRPD